MATRIHHIPLSELPADMQLPGELKERFWFDAEHKRLCFNGFMSKSVYDRLKVLSRDELYQRALEDLFRICVPDDEPSGSTRKTWLRRAMLISFVSLVLLSGLALCLHFMQ
jgi:hypothetical protein